MRPKKTKKSNRSSIIAAAILLTYFAVGGYLIFSFMNGTITFEQAFNGAFLWAMIGCLPISWATIELLL